MAKYNVVGSGFGPITREGRFYLNKNTSSWIDTFMLPSELRTYTDSKFEQIWNLHPEKRGRIQMSYVPRWQQSYGLPYWFSGMMHKSLPVPQVIQPIVDYANNQSGYGPFNQVLVNWYNIDDYIGKHSDDISAAIRNDGGTTVFSLTIQESNAPVRVFRVKPITGGRDRLDIFMPHGIVLVMGGRTQETHTHQVPRVIKRTIERYKTNKWRGRRINITLRNHRSK